MSLEGHAGPHAVAQVDFLAKERDVDVGHQVCLVVRVRLYEFAHDLVFAFLGEQGARHAHEVPEVDLECFCVQIEEDGAREHAAQ